MNKCFEGWAEDNGNTSGSCCCNCRYQRPISGHPWNKRMGHPLQGSVADIIGWGCTVPDMPAITFFEFEHGMCEMHMKKMKQA